MKVHIIKNLLQTTNPNLQVWWDQAALQRNIWKFQRKVIKKPMERMTRTQAIKTYFNLDSQGMRDTLKACSSAERQYLAEEAAKELGVELEAAPEEQVKMAPAAIASAVES